MISVLVVDDSVVIRRVVTDVLSADPQITVAGSAADGKIALAKIEELKPDLITLDIEMPVMDGLTCLREVRKRHPRLPVIMFSVLTAAGATATLDALASGASDYVTKPANAASVSAAMVSIRAQLIPRIYALCGRTSLRARSRAAHPPTTDRGGGTGLTIAQGIGPTGATSVASRLTGLRKTLGGGAQTGAGTPVLGRGIAAAANAPQRPAPAQAPPATRPRSLGRPDLLAIGSSTGGPEALRAVLTGLPANLPVPVVVVQHMPPTFTKILADRLNKEAALRVVEATDGMPLDPGTVYIAPGDKHLEVSRSSRGVITKLHDGPPENQCRPAVDVLFRSVAAAYGGACVAVVLTGMGQDGTRGARVLHDAGAEVVAQDEESSVVWGMPGSVVRAGIADKVLPINDIAGHLVGRLGRGSKPLPVEVTR